MPIHGEKTNILFHPTPSTSYEPTFKSLENKAGALGIGIFISIIILGKLFGGALKGLIPLALCVTSGVWLWTKEVIRSGREVEWDSEKERGLTVSLRWYLRISFSVVAHVIIGYGEFTTRVGGMVKHAGWNYMGLD